MKKKRTIVKGGSKIEVIYRHVSISKRGKKNKTAVKKSVDVSPEEKKKKILEKNKVKAENKRRKQLREIKLKKLIDAEISKAIKVVIDDAENLMPQKMMQSWSQKTRIEKSRWLRMVIRKWMNENDCEEINDLKCSPEFISAVALLKVELEDAYNEALKKYQNHLKAQKAKEEVFREEQLRKFRRRSRVDQLKIQKAISKNYNFVDNFEKNHGYD